MDNLKDTIHIDRRNYAVVVRRSAHQGADAPRLAVVAYQPNTTARRILQACIQAIQKITTTPYELWVIDNHSPEEHCQWLLDWPDINVILNRTKPSPRGAREIFWRLAANLKGRRRHPYEASYDNAIALELAVRRVEPSSKYLMSLHMDTLPCHPNWLGFLQSKIDQGFAAAGVRLDKSRDAQGILHVLGCMVDFSLFRSLQLSYLPRLPEYDAGDLVTVNLRQAGQRLYACRNTLWQPELAERIPYSLPLRDMQVDRAFDDDGNVIFLHLGRGVRKSLGEAAKGVTPEEWLRFAQEHLLGAVQP